ncbi:transcriptional activator DEMETER-like isoform X2 [Phalaenopsis equestris]|uniref:transcriptional activator DEMETER-like isoform X2 n=1 Tax=Phalaenopsis equestris TaxID=78828 RepID=UPI0009E245B0|nr:transcriptional activator DEMETER-like isoform X2 [Phalaenopsis equestris]
MKRAREIDGGENKLSCIVLLKNQLGYFGWEGRRQRGHGDGTPFGVISDLHSSREILQASSCSVATEVKSSGAAAEEVYVSGTQPAACSGSEFPEALISDKPKDGVCDDLGKLEADPRKERRKREKRKKHRPKVVEIERTERKPKMEIPMPPQTPNQKTPVKKKGKMIGRRTFARKKLFANSLADNDGWEEAGDQPNRGSVDETINPSSRIQIDEGGLAAEMDVESCGSGLFAENLPAGSTYSYGDVNIGIDELLQELAKLPMKSSSPLLLKADLLQLNIESPLASLSYILDNIRIPCLLDFAKQARRNIDKSRTKTGYKLRNGLYYSANKVLDDFMCVFKNFLPNLLLKNDKSTVSGQMFNNKGGGRSKKNISGSKELKATGKRKSMPATNFEIVPYTHLCELSSRFQHIEASCTTPMTSNFTANGQKTQTSGDINNTLIQHSSNTMELALQSVVDNIRSVDIDEGFHADDPTELGSAIVPFVGGGMIVPYNRSSEQVKQKTHRAEVLLDPETDRMWRLLKENKDEHNVEGMDSCNLQWWENERQVFLGRAKSFTARMNLILGDRRFSPWKGSIVDSVVGVFLTQNVSDHLSSSAFMSLAAKFPVAEGGCSERKSAEQNEETSTDSMACPDDIPCLSNCDDQDTMDIQLNGQPLESMAGQSCHFQNSLGLTEKIENSMIIDVDGCTSKQAEIISTVFYENEQNDCRDLPLVLSESTTFSSINKYPIDTMDVEMEATTSYSSKLKANFRFEKNASSVKKGNFVDEVKIDWEDMRRKIDDGSGKKVRSYESLDSVNWEKVRNADVNEVSEAIRERGMNNLLAERIKDFLNRLVRDHGSIDLEWLRNICPDDTKKYLLSIRGLGIKSVECVRLLALKNVAFPVDTNVARISVRLGWVPLKPLPEFLQLHLLEQYELHYHMITFGKVFCTKNRPNCKICPMRGECKHFNSAKLALPAPDEKQFKTPFPFTHSTGCSSLDAIPQLQYNNRQVSGVLCDNCDPVIEHPPSPIIEESPPSPPLEALQILDTDIEDAFYEDDEIPTIKLDLKQFGKKLQNLIQENDMKIPDNDISKALVELSAEAASIQARKLKHISGLRTEHHVYELPDSHLLLEGMDQREPDDPSPYLLAIWTPGETAQSIEPPQSCCEIHETGLLCERETCFACNSRRELEAQTVRGTLLIPCRTAMRGRFPLNGTYFQTNEVFADHDSSRNPIQVPRSCLWNLPRRTVYFGTSIAAIFRGFTATEPIQYCFSKGFVCVRGFDRTTREPKPLYARLHLPRSKAPPNKKPWVRREE